MKGDISKLHKRHFAVQWSLFDKVETGPSESWCPLSGHSLILIPVWMSNNIHYRVWDEITYPFPNSTVQPFTTVYWTRDYLSILGLKLTMLAKRGPWDLTGDNIILQPNYVPNLKDYINDVTFNIIASEFHSDNAIMWIGMSTSKLQLFLSPSSKITQIC